MKRSPIESDFVNGSRGILSAFFLALNFILFLATPAFAGDGRTRVVLDSRTFPKSSRVRLSRIADKVAREIDRLIPGKLGWGVNGTLLCFVSPENWPDKPLVVFGKPHAGEPAAVRSHSIRIAVRSNVLPNAYQRFAFQLAHELAHVKNGHWISLLEIKSSDAAPSGFSAVE